MRSFNDYFFIFNPFQINLACRVDLVQPKCILLDVQSVSKNVDLF